MSEIVVTFTGPDSCEVEAHGITLLCDRLSGRWHAAKAIIGGEEKRTPDCFVLSDEIVSAIEKGGNPQ